MIFLDTNVISEDLRQDPDESVISWLQQHDTEIALPAVVIAEIAFGINKIHPDQRAARLEKGLIRWRRRFSRQIFAFTESAALAYGELMGDAKRAGRVMQIGDGMIAATARAYGGKLATRNVRHFETTGLDLINPWEF